ncbi:glycosyltransferase family 2 protein [Gillisia sp. JM1]|uniref:glycosyltransferase family 2 protein n=1 Tax=Gillisia sp. JM1 TaxID=1283286 RepID=UPI0004795BE1|nr:glycosyltransferase family 2 protein [Gillisia sp. JM1]
MEKISIIFAYRNREISRIKIAMDSLESQNNKAFEVIFVNYGSETEISGSLEKLLRTYKFVTYHSLEVRQQLWNKSRALNFAIKKASYPYIFIADVDIVFSPDAVEVLMSRASPKDFCLFKMGYLNKKESSKLNNEFKFENLKPERYGEINGMILTTKEAFFYIKGYDEFFHFYGSEDVDLYTRLENAGYKSNLVNDIYFYHNWHKSYQKSDYKKLSVIPRLTNALRINQQHYFYHQKEMTTSPKKQEFWGEIIEKTKSELLERPTKKVQLINILAQVEHFFNEELQDIKNEIVEVKAIEDPYYNSIKHKAKRLLGKQSQTYCSLKEVNDIILKMIIFNFRNSNYSYEISNDLKSIIFKVQL